MGEQLGKPAGKPAFKYEVKEYKAKFEDTQRLTNPKTHVRPRFGRSLKLVLRKLDGTLGFVVGNEDWEKVVGKKVRINESGGFFGLFGGENLKTASIPGITTVTTFKKLEILAVNIQKIEKSYRDKTVTLTIGKLEDFPAQQYEQTNPDRRTGESMIKYKKIICGGPFDNLYGSVTSNTFSKIRIHFETLGVEIEKGYFEPCDSLKSFEQELKEYTSKLWSYRSVIEKQEKESAKVKAKEAKESEARVKKTRKRRC